MMLKMIHVFANNKINNLQFWCQVQTQGYKLGNFWATKKHFVIKNSIRARNQ